MFHLFFNTELKGFSNSFNCLRIQLINKTTVIKSYASFSFNVYRAGSYDVPFGSSLPALLVEVGGWLL